MYMKKLWFLTLILLPTMAMANPFLVCDPQTDADEYVVTTQTGQPVNSQPYSEVTLSDGSTVAIVMDLAAVGEGTHNWEVQACNDMGECSSAVPFVYQKTLPGEPSGMRLEKL